MRTEGEQPNAHEAFWHIDEELGELELRERPSGPDIYTVRLKAHAAQAPYHAKQEIYPLRHNGTEREVSGKTYILVPDIALTVDLFPTPSPAGAIGTVSDSQWQGMRHHDLANVRGLYYEEDQAIGIWGVDTWGRLDEYAHGRLWQLFERFMLQRFPRALRIFTDDAEPGEDEVRNRQFLHSLGYKHVTGTHRVFGKEVPQ